MDAPSPSLSTPPLTTPLAPWWRRRFGIVSFTAATLLHLAAISILLLSVRSGSAVVILRYNSYLGVDLLGVWWQIFLVPAVTYFFVLVNLVLMELLTRRDFGEIALLLALGNWFISGATVVVAAALAFINI